MSMSCPFWTKDDKTQVENLDFWIGSISTCTLAVFGILTNIVMLGKLQKVLKHSPKLNCLIFGLALLKASFYF